MTKEKLESVLSEVQRRSMTDADFRKKLLENSQAVIEEVAGEKLPEGVNFKIVESDPNYTATLVLPDLISDEFSAEDLDATAGGISAVLIVSVCAAAVGSAGCAGEACGAQGCVADLGCAGQACGARGQTV